MLSKPCPSSVLLACLALASCDEDGGGSTGSPSPEQSVRGLHEARVAYADAAAASHSAAVELVRLASRDFTATVPSMLSGEAGVEFPIEATGEMAAAADDLTGAARRQLVSAHALTAAWSAVAEHEQRLGWSQPAEVGASVEQLRSGLICGGLCIAAVGGAVMTAYAFFGGAEEIADEMGGFVVEKIRNGSEADVACINVELGLPADATRLRALEAYQALPALRRGNKSKEIEQAMHDCAFTPEGAAVQPPDANEIRQSFGRAAVKGGELGVTQVAGWWATGGGGQGVAQVLEACGVSASAAAVVDLAYSVVGAQPLDGLSKNLDVTVTSAEKKQQVIPPPAADEPPPAQAVPAALATLQDESAPAAAVQQAAATVARDIAEKTEAAVAKAADGALTVEVPAQVFHGRVEVTGETAVAPVLAVGLAEIVVSGDGLAAEVFPEIDTARPQTLVLAGLTPAEEAAAGPPEDPTLLRIRPPASLEPDTQLELVVECPDGVAFPATLDVTSPPDAIVGWGSPVSACPVTVLFNGSAERAYQLVFTLRDAQGAVFRGTLRLTIGAEPEPPPATDDPPDVPDPDDAPEGTWVDPVTGLMWQNAWPGVSSESVPYLGFADAQSYCGNLDLGGHGDWHLPDVDQGRAFIRGCADTVFGGACGVSTECDNDSDVCWCGTAGPRCDVSGRAPCSGCRANGGPQSGAGNFGCYWDPMIVGNCQPYWTTTVHQHTSYLNGEITGYAPDGYWSIYFPAGSIGHLREDEESRVRCVRE